MRTGACDTLRDLYLRSCRWSGAQDLFADERERASGTEALERSLRLARGLQALGVARGEVVAFLSRASTRHALAWFAGIVGGMVVCNLHVRETPQRIGEALAWLGATALLHDAELEDLAREALARSGVRCTRVSLGAPGSADACYDELVAANEPLAAASAAPAADELAAIVLSSGSTGRPKGILHTQRTLLEAAKGGQYAFGGVGRRDATLLFMQPSFAAWAIVMLPFVGAGAKTCFGAQFTPVDFLEAVARERITLGPLVPTMWRMVLDEDLSRHDLSSLRIVTIAGEPPAARDIARLHAHVCPRIASLYLAGEGFTASAVVAFTEDLLREGKAASTGRPAPGVDVKIIDPMGGFDDELPPGEVGEIALSGPSLAVGYWKDPELTRARFRERWWRSGDLGRIDSDGDLWVVGRIDNLINSGGIKVSGEEVERALLSHPAVAQCAVVGAPDATFGERVVAYVVVRGAPPSETDLDAFCRGPGGLAGFKVPRAYRFVSELPTGPTGKLYRRALRG